MGFKAGGFVLGFGTSGPLFSKGEHIPVLGKAVFKSSCTRLAQNTVLPLL